MKTLIIAVLLAIPAAAHAERVGYYDLGRAMSESAEGKKNAADEAADQAAKQAEIEKAKEAAAKAKPAERQAAQERATQLFQRHLQAIQSDKQQHAAALGARIARIVPAVAKAKHLDVLFSPPGPFYVAPPMDLTSEVVRRLDAGDGKLSAEDAERVARENVELRAELDKARAEKLTKPTPPTVPPPPPIQPLAAKGKK
jgi:Skp family chaperone for outer membrane proteins